MAVPLNAHVSIVQVYIYVCTYVHVHTGTPRAVFSLKKEKAVLDVYSATHYKA